MLFQLVLKGMCWGVTKGKIGGLTVWARIRRQVAERLGNQASNQKVAGLIPGRAKWHALGQGTSPYFPWGECPCTYCKSLWIRASKRVKWLKIVNVKWICSEERQYKVVLVRELSHRPSHPRSLFTGGSISGAVFNPVLALSIQFPCSGNTFLEYCFVYWLGPLLGKTDGMYAIRSPPISSYLILILITWYYRITMTLA